MPGSRVVSVASSGSVGSRYSKRYRTKSKQSSIDETLFASPSKTKVQGTQDNNDTSPPAPVFKSGLRSNGLRSKTRKPETIQVITKDLIRNVVIPSNDPSGLTVVLKPFNYERVRRAARVRSREEIQAEYQMTKKEKEEAMVCG